MKNVRFTEEEKNRAKEINGNYYTIICRNTIDGKVKVAAVWIKNGNLIADWAIKTVNYKYEINPTIISLNSEIISNKDSIKFINYNKRFSKK